MRTISKALFGLAAVALLGVASANAQSQTGSITASAVVQQPINVVGAVNLAFGNVFPGVSKTIAVTDAGAGRFDVTGAASAPVFMSFVLPANLTVGANTLPIGNWSGHHNTSNSPSGGTSFTPSAGLTSAAFSGSGNLYVFVGGQVTPASNQAAGTYTGTVQMTVTY